MSERARATRKIVAASDSRVMSGPFEGMIWSPNRVAWGDGDIGSRLLGVYEQELHLIVEHICNLKPNRIVNIGCAEGYYSVGLARRLPHTQVIAVDRLDSARSYVLASADENNVAVSTQMEAPEPMIGDVWIVDIEGGEAQLLDPQVRPALLDCTILVELHEWKHEALLDLMVARFLDSHKIIAIDSGPRDPNEFDVCREMSDVEKWAVMSEGRPQAMTWLWMVPR